MRLNHDFRKKVNPTTKPLLKGKFINNVYERSSSIIAMMIQVEKASKI